MTREEAIDLIRRIVIKDSRLWKAIESLIPELAESEDERIRKALIDGVRQIRCKNGITQEQMISYLEKQKEQKPAESISQLTVQGKGVYKICPHCKSRMIRDDSKVYTSMPPQYGYNCPNCGAMEFDTVMYDNPEMEERKPVEWSEEDERIMGRIQMILEFFDRNYPADMNIGSEVPKYIAWLKSLRPQPSWKPSEEQIRSLEYFVKLWGNTDEQIEYVKIFNDVKSLLGDLKKL